MAADLPGTAFTYTPLTDDPGGDAYEAAQMNTAYEEIEAISTWFGAGTAIASGGGIRLTIADGANTVGYTGQKAEYGLAGTPQTVIPGGAFDVTVGAVVAYMVEPSSGSASGGIITIYNGDTETIYDDGTNTVTLTVAAAGQMTTVRATGSLTYNVVLNILVWI